MTEKARLCQQHCFIKRLAWSLRCILSSIKKAGTNFIMKLAGEASWKQLVEDYLDRGRAKCLRAKTAGELARLCAARANPQCDQSKEKVTPPRHHRNPTD